MNSIKGKLTISSAIILAGILLGISFPPFKTWYLVYPGLIILIHLVYSASRLRQAFFRGYVVLVIFNVVSTYWIGHWDGDDTFLKIGGAATELVHPLFMLFPLLIAYGIYKGLKKDYAIFLFPFIWTGYEYLDNIWQLSFPWIEIGNTETYNLNRIQYIDLIGVHGATFIICLTAIIIYFLIAKLIKSEWKFSSIPAIGSVIAILVLLNAPYYYSYQKLHSPDNAKYYSTADSTKLVKSVIIQPNIDPDRKWRTNRDSLVDSYILRLNNALKTNADFFVVHETAVPYPFFEEYFYSNTKKILDFVNINKKYLLIGIQHRYYYPDTLTAPQDSKIASVTRRRYDDFNSAILLEPDKTIENSTIHEKVKLVPFSERPPYVDKLPFLSKWIKWGVGISDWQIGKGLEVFDLNNTALKNKTKFSTLICFESVFSDFVRESVNNGAEFLVIITNDGWFGKSAGPVQHDRYAVMRAIENRKWIIRAAQTGISDFIDPLGNQYESTEMNTDVIITKTIIANNEVTFYAAHGDIIGKAGYYVFIICLLLSIIIYYAYNRKRRTAA